MASPEFASKFARETWALYGFGVFAIAVRIIARIRRLTVTGLQIDDALMGFALLSYTLLVVSLNEVASGGGSNLMTQEEIDALTPATHDERVRGSKWVFVSEHAMVLTIWTLKFCMLIIYGRITDGLKQSRLVHYAALYTFLTFVGTEVSLFFACRPLSLYWAVPTPNYQCSSYQHYEIAQGVLSITSNIVILFVAMPIIIAVRLPRRQKIILLFLFGLGILDVIAALVTKLYCLVPSLIGYQYMNWYVREATIAMLVTNLPLSWSLVRDLVPGLAKWINSSSVSYQRHSWPGGINSVHRSHQSQPSQDSSKTSSRSVAEDRWSERDVKEFEAFDFGASVTLSSSREHTPSHPQEIPMTSIPDEDADVEKARRVIYVRNSVMLEVQPAPVVVDGAYPVWDWMGNPDHVSTCEITGGLSKSGWGPGNA